ncbi:hypothetical protein [Desulfobulbus alkaliphilus]|uniref:hypothetical protein n=1 Tax=Desulfobulbus alkaliphilus TaxID=869814 RepID=UPI0019643177|nr:hypothetical protein [Desulfobulbus alkaliphilus]MBM9537998.1 hypothetical protein [Desulfobulbus alkaliphilus]
MRELRVAFAGLSVLLRHDHDDVDRFLHFLFADLIGCGEDGERIVEILVHERQGWFLLVCKEVIQYTGPLGVGFAAALYDLVIYQLLDTNCSGVALHAGALVRDGRVMLLPGASGAGKSTLTSWMAVQEDITCLTDELVLVTEDGQDLLLTPFPRPLCLKPGSRDIVKTFFPKAALTDSLEDDQGLLVPLRGINAVVAPSRLVPAWLLFPVFRPGASLALESLSPARTLPLLISCDVNGRNFADHGFNLLARLARSTSAHRLVFSSFDGLEKALKEFFPPIHELSG